MPEGSIGELNVEIAAPTDAFEASLERAALAIEKFSALGENAERASAELASAMERSGQAMQQAHGTTLASIENAERQHIERRAAIMQGAVAAAERVAAEESAARSSGAADAERAASESLARIEAAEAQHQARRIAAMQEGVRAAEAVGLAEVEARTATFGVAESAHRDSLERIESAQDAHQARMGAIMEQAVGIAETTADRVTAAETSGAAESERARERHLQRIQQLEEQYQARKAGVQRQAVRTAAATAAEEVRARVAALEAAFREDMARIKEGQLRQFITPAEAAKAGREAAQAYNAGLLTVLDQGARAGAFRGAAGRDLFTQVAGSIRQVNTEARRAVPGLGQLRLTLATVASTAAGVNPHFARVASVLSGFALGGVVTVGVLAGVSAIGFAWKKLTEDARSLQQAVQRSTERIREMWLQLQTQGDIEIINLVEPMKRQRDLLFAELRRIERDIAAAEPIMTSEGLVTFDETRLRRDAARVQKQIDELNERIDEGDRILQSRITERQKAEAERRRREAERAQREASQRAVEEARTVEERIAAIIRLGEAGIATQAQMDELAAAAERWKRTLSDTTADISAQADALDNLTRAAKAFTAMQIEMIRRNVVPTTLPRGGTVQSPTGRVERIQQGETLPERLGREGPSSQFDAFKAGVGGHLQLGPAAQEMKEVIDAAVSGMGPFALLLPIINSALAALEPVLAALLEPFHVIGELVAAVITPSLKLLEPPLKATAIAFSFVVQGIGWLLEAIGRFINFIVPFGDPADRLVREGKAMQRAAIDARNGLNEVAKATQAVTSSMQNVPLIFNHALERIRIAQGESRNAVPRAGNVTVGTVNIAASPTGDTPDTLWTKFQRGMENAAMSGNVLARGLVLGTA